MAGASRLTLWVQATVESAGRALASRFVRAAGRALNAIGSALITAAAATLKLSYQAALQDTRSHEYTPEEASRCIQYLQNQADKARQRAQERVLHRDEEMLGMSPKLWLEALDERHRYGSWLYPYWQRWEISRTQMTFFKWLDHGRGSLIDLPSMPRRFLDEGQVLYLTNEQLRLVEVQAVEGKLVWVKDGSLVTVPSSGTPSTTREVKLDRLISARLKLSRHREALLASVRRRAEEAIAAGLSPPGDDELSVLLSALLEEGLMRKLRDPCFEQRPFASDTTADDSRYVTDWLAFQVSPLSPHAEVSPRAEASPHARLSPHAGVSPHAEASPHAEMSSDAEPPPLVMTASGHRTSTAAGALYELPKKVLPGTTWEDVVDALNHEEGHGMSNPIQSAEKRLRVKDKLGIFVLDQFGKAYCAEKVRGVFHHSSITRGHCVRFAGGVSIVDGEIKALSPHSGHYTPTQTEYDDAVAAWKGMGLDLTPTKIMGLAKIKQSVM